MLQYSSRVMDYFLFRGNDVSLIEEVEKMLLTFHLTTQELSYVTGSDESCCYVSNRDLYVNSSFVSVLALHVFMSSEVCIKNRPTRSGQHRCCCCRRH